MKFRQLRVIATRQWVNVLFTVDGEFSVPAASHLASIAAALGVSPATLEVVDDATDLRTGTLRQVPVPLPPDPAPDPDLAAFDIGTVDDKFTILRRRVLGQRL
jgi:hypothetical protein